MIKVVWNVIKKIFGAFFCMLSPLKRLWCRRKRRNSDTILPLTNHYPSVENLNSNYSAVNGSSQVQQELSPWDTWEEEKNQKIRSVEEYRQRQLTQRQQSEEIEPEPNYFQDMTPRVKKQKKILIKKKEEYVNTGSISNKLAMNSDVPILPAGELQSWEEQHNAWDVEEDEDLGWEADNIIREKRKLDREQRQLQHQKRKQERDQRTTNKSQPHLSAVRLS